MSAYELNKLIRQVNQSPARREAFFADPPAFAKEFDLDDAERDALLTTNVGRLYKLGVHGLILRPFTLLQKMPEADYLAAIRS